MHNHTSIQDTVLPILEHVMNDDILLEMGWMIVRRLAALLIIAGLLWFLYGDTLAESGVSGVFVEMKEDLHNIIEHPWVQSAYEVTSEGVKNLANFISESQQTEQTEENKIEKPELDIPAEQTFSILNIEIGDFREVVEMQLGNPKRASKNEYGTNWYAYHDDYRNFVMISYDDKNRVNGIYTNQDLLSSTNGISFSSTREEVLAKLPNPQWSIRKGFINYQIQDNGEYNLFEMDNCYVTIFYDIHQDSKLSAILIIEKSLEDQKSGYFGKPSDSFREGLEYQLFDLTNAARVKHGLSILSWHEPTRNTVRAHSEDMAENQYFDHTNLEGQSPFDRLAEDAISFRTAGENLATGQPNSIFAHEGLMNSIGHRENKLKSDYSAYAAGVAFDRDDQPFYTENYLGN